MKIALALLLSGVLFAVDAQSQQPRPMPAAVEMQAKLLSLELPASRTDQAQVGEAINGFARRHAFQATSDASSPLWNIQRFYIGEHGVSLVLSFFPDHTFVGLSKRPGDADGYQDLVEALRGSFLPLGFKPWMEPTE